jgi:hypothetical protein
MESVLEGARHMPARTLLWEAREGAHEDSKRCVQVECWLGIPHEDWPQADRTHAPGEGGFR